MTSRKRIGATLIGLALGVSVTALAGCAPEGPAPAAGGTYFNGPMVPKDQAGGAPGAPTNPNEPTVKGSKATLPQ